MLDAFHIVKLAGDALDEVRRRVQQDTTGHRRRKGDPLYPGPQSFARLTRAGSPHVNKNDSERPSWQMRRISVSKSPTTAPSKSELSSIKPHPPKADAWPLVSSSAYQPVPSPKSLAWARPYASGRTHSTPTSTQAEPATHRTEAINGHYRAGQTNRQRLPQPHQLPTLNAPHHRRPRCLHPHSTLKSRETAGGPVIVAIALASITVAPRMPRCRETRMFCKLHLHSSPNPTHHTYKSKELQKCKSTETAKYIQLAAKTASLYTLYNLHTQSKLILMRRIAKRSTRT